MPLNTPVEITCHDGEVLHVILNEKRMVAGRLYYYIEGDDFTALAACRIASVRPDIMK